MKSFGKLQNAFRIAVGIACGISATRASATDLGIVPIAQQTPQWCWAASSEMVLQHFAVPNVNPVRGYQCAIVAAQGGYCFVSCGYCLGSGGTTGRIATVIRAYLQLAGQQNLGVYTAGPLTPSQIAQLINQNDPIIAGISPTGMAYPAGSGFSEHAVVIDGYDGVPGAPNFSLIVNDPLPTNLPLWMMAGAVQRQAGQYEISYQAFVWSMRFGNSIVVG